jgi:pimeloyl-ACP methyl ester carboxylesterase
MLTEMGISESDAKLRANNTDWDTIYAIRKKVEHIGFQEILPSVNIPSMFFAGTDDYFYPKAKMTSEAMKNSVFESIEGLNHAISFRRSQLILPQILDFLAKYNP